MEENPFGAAFVIFVAIALVMAWFFMLGGAAVFALGLIIYLLKKYIFWIKSCLPAGSFLG